MFFLAFVSTQNSIFAPFSIRHPFYKGVKRCVCILAMCLSALGERMSDARLLLLLLMIMLSVSGCLSMDVIMPSKIDAKNGSDIKIPCTFTSCYKIDTKQFIMNWTYHESINDTEQRFLEYNRKKGMVTLLPERFGDRVVFAGNLEKNDLSIILSDVQEEDEGIYNCYVINPPDRIHGRGSIKLNVLTKLPPPRDSTIAVAIGASVGGALALLILSMVVVKFLRHHLKQDLTSEEKMEEEGKLEPEVATEEGPK
nr:sodium channel subunit beta-2-like [Nerophis lumbriciformis]